MPCHFTDNRENIVIWHNNSISCFYSFPSRISQRGVRQPQRGGAPTYYLTNFSRKLHENEEIFVQRWGRASLAPPLDPPLISDGKTATVALRTWSWSARYWPMIFPLMATVCSATLCRCHSSPSLKKIKTSLIKPSLIKPSLIKPSLTKR